MFLSNLQKEKKEYFVYVHSYSISLVRGRSNIIFHLGREGGGGSWFLYEKCKKGGGGGGGLQDLPFIQILSESFRFFP